MKPCRKCGNPLGLKVDQCPACGTAVKKRTSGCAILFLIFVAVPIIGGIVISSINAVNQPSTSPSVAEKKGDYIGAWTMAQQFVKDTLKSPSTANFGGLFDQIPKDNVELFGDKRYLVRIWVDSQNGFGATIRTHFVVKLEKGPNGEWTLIEPPRVVQR